MRVKCALEHAVTSIAYLISFSMHIALITAPFQVRANERETWNSWNEMNLFVNGRIMFISHLSRPPHLFSDCHTLNECIILQHWQNDWNGEDAKKDEHRVHVCGRRRESLQSADAASFQLLCHLAVVYFVDLKLFGVLCARMIYGDFMWMFVIKTRNEREILQGSMANSKLSNISQKVALSRIEKYVYFVYFSAKA